MTPLFGAIDSLSSLSGSLTLSEDSLVGDWEADDHTFTFNDDGTYLEVYDDGDFSYANAGTWTLSYKNDEPYLFLYDIYMQNFTFHVDNDGEEFGFEVYFVKVQSGKLYLEFFCSYKFNHFADEPPTFFELFDDKDPWGWEAFDPA